MNDVFPEELVDIDGCDHVSDEQREKLLSLIIPLNWFGF